jgi:hypothetical protein
MEVPELRGPRHALQAVEGQGELVVFQRGVKDVCGSPLQRGQSEAEVPLYLFRWVAGENLADG